MTIRRTLRSMRHYHRKHHGRLSYFPLLGIVSLDLVTHVLYSVIRFQSPWKTLHAYSAGLYDVLTLKEARF